MALKVYDYRTDVRSVLVTPQIRSRFMRLEVGEEAEPHSHDLGHEIFLVLDGRAEFTIAGETGEVGPGQMCVALVDELHSLRVLGDRPMTMYLSVTPHIQPTHTMWTPDGERLPHRFASSTAYDVQTDTTTPFDELLDRLTAATLAVRAFGTIAGSMIHDLYGLRDLFGVPTKVLSTEIWQDGGAITTTLEYPQGVRCVASWVDLPDLWDFYETLEVYGSRKRVIISYPTGFSREVADLKIHEIDQNGTSIAKEPALDWESPFRRELRHFHDCIVNGTASRSPLIDAGQDVALVIDIVKAYLDGGR